MEAANSDNASIDRKLRYKELIERGAEVGESLANHSVIESLTRIMDIINNCENISTSYAREAKPENTADYLMDAQIIKMSHDLMGSMSEKMSNNDFREDEFIASLINMMTTNPNNILDTAIGCCKSAKFQLSLLGTFDFDAVQKPLEVVKKVRQRPRKTLEPKAAPENIKQITKTDKGAEKINIVHAEIKRVLQERKVDHIPYYEAVINPQDFMKSIDTAFQVSFLIRDGILGVDVVNDVPHLYYKGTSATPASQIEDTNNTGQAIMSLNPQKWKEEAQKYKIKTPQLHLTSTENEEIDDDDSDDSD